MTTFCADCGGQVEANWKFCEHCGAPAAPTADADGQCRATTRAGRRCRRQAIPGHAACTTHLGTEAAVTAPLPAVGAEPVATPPPPPPPPVPVDVLVGGAAPSRSSLKVAALAAGAAVVLLALVLGILNIVGTHRRLDDTREELTTTQRDLGTTRGELVVRTAERDDLRTKLSDAETELGGVKQSLTDTRTKVDAQAGQIDSLKTCLDGVLTALNSETAEEAVRILDSIETACERAVELL